MQAYRRCVMTEVITIERDIPTITGLPEDYMMYHFTFHKGIFKMLRPHGRNGIDVIFLYREDNIKSFCKKIDRFWHNLRKVVGNKYEFRRIKDRTVLHMINTYEDGGVLMKQYNEMAANPGN
jgi:hypothetical protein